MNNTGLIWLAGLLDGEGCIHINRHRADKRADLRTDTFRLYVQITMGHLATLELCREITGLGTVQPHTVSNKKANAAFCWMTSAGDAEQVIKNLRPYLFTKAPEADIALSFCEIEQWYGGRFRGQKPQRLVDAAAKHYWQLRMLKPRWRFYEKKLSANERQELKRLKLTSRV